MLPVDLVEEVAQQLLPTAGRDTLARQNWAGRLHQEIAYDPGAHAVIGLRNHGITATGATLEEILDRIVPSLLPQVPMT